ncbi:type II secretion system inner membrane protein GspF [Quisquiliibacterium transsilvanicum]|uniref:General secretion pathway protein F n=1 Tax=Quisquiliibacterium transsilvanicum TaxID=1549638 RepID=A0A7W8MAM2_9BURK|nr:type II secretion system inner membrane protein GspF [Quisquiliibacterium transsilvanicum]MBB5273837.1 general secretion pathway protein F [Quisquiliibacterium transsilvanicum]
MSAYRFEASTVDGRIEKGVLDADSPRQARTLLRERGLVPIEVLPAGAAGGMRQALGGRIRTAELTLVTRQLSSLLSARLPLEQALGAVIEQAERPAVRDRLAAVRSEVVSGQTFAQALSRFPRDFPDVYRALVAAGEQSGDLALVMDRLADYVEARTALSQRITLAFTYPAIVTLVAIGVITALLAYVVPQVVGVFAQSRQELPMLTKALIAASDFVRNWGWWMLAALVAAGFAFRAALRSPSFRLTWHERLLELPLFGRLIRGINTARFASTLGILAASGVPLIRALEAGAQTLGNDALRANVADAISRVREGAPLSRALAAGGQFPPMMVHMIASGESTGNLAEMLQRTAATLSSETERRAIAMTSILEPMLILLMGGVVLLIVLAVLLPIIEINQLVR